MLQRRVPAAANIVANNIRQVKEIKVAIMGDMNSGYEPHYLMNKCFNDIQQLYAFSFEWIQTADLESNSADTLKNYAGIVAGSGPYKSKNGIISGIRYARTNNVPFLGTCSGFGYAVLELGQALFGLETIHHPREGIQLLGNERLLQEVKDCSVGMRTISFTPVTGTLAGQVYAGEGKVEEQSHCSYGINTQFLAEFAHAGLVVSAQDDEGEPKIMAYQPNDFFMLTLFLPQLRSSPENPHPILSSFFKAVSQKKLTTGA
jgi:CTP synthase (UTP-ammonia lyase)